MSGYHVLLGKKHNIRKLAMQLEAIERQLQLIESDTKYLPSPMDMEALSWMRCNLPLIADYANVLDKKLQKRINKWQNTPYTKTELRKNLIAEFIGWWFAASATILTSIINWFASSFSELWHSLLVSAIIGLALVIVFWINESK